MEPYQRIKTQPSPRPACLALHPDAARVCSVPISRVYCTVLELSIWGEVWICFFRTATPTELANALRLV